ncbi:MAG: VanW family protein [Candidatus Margulisbacteria bacterium]|nr:VanW family protein [Candidatus Margulisiibacteriota bacterium]
MKYYKKTFLILFSICLLSLASYLLFKPFPCTWIQVTSSLSGRSAEQLHNITLAANKINKTIIPVQKVFSFNQLVGPYSIAEGFLPERTYLAGQTVESAGGGICQVASTLYYALLNTGLKVTERTNHMFPIQSLPMGFDATVAEKGADLCFINNTYQPIMLKASIKNDRLFITICGSYFKPVKTQLERQVFQLKNNVYSVKVYQDQNKISDDLYYLN